MVTMICRRHQTCCLLLLAFAAASWTRTTDAFVGVRRPALVVPALHDRQTCVATFSTPTSKTTALKALPVDPEAIRFLSGAAGKGEGINTGIIYDSVGSAALKLFGIFMGVQVFLTLLAIAGTVFVVIPYADKLVRELQNEYPEKWQEIQVDGTSLWAEFFGMSGEAMREKFREGDREEVLDRFALLMSLIEDENGFAAEFIEEKLQQLSEEKLG